MLKHQKGLHLACSGNKMVVQAGLIFTSKDKTTQKQNEIQKIQKQSKIKQNTEKSNKTTNITFRQ